MVLRMMMQNMAKGIDINITTPSIVTIQTQSFLSERSAVLSISLLIVVVIDTALVYADDILCKEITKFIADWCSYFNHCLWIFIIDLSWTVVIYIYTMFETLKNVILKLTCRMMDQQESIHFQVKHNEGLKICNNVSFFFSATSLSTTCIIWIYRWVQLFISNSS